MFKVNNKNTRTKSGVFIVNFEQENVSWEEIVVMSLPILSMSGSNLSNDSNGISSIFRV